MFNQSINVDTTACLMNTVTPRKRKSVREKSRRESQEERGRPWYIGSALYINCSSDRYCTRGMIHYTIHPISPGCPGPVQPYSAESWSNTSIISFQSGRETCFNDDLLHSSVITQRKQRKYSDVSIKTILFILPPTTYTILCFVIVVNLAFSLSMISERDSRSIMVSSWTTDQQVQRSILHPSHDSYQYSFKLAQVVPGPV